MSETNLAAKPQPKLARPAGSAVKYGAGWPVLHVTSRAESRRGSARASFGGDRVQVGRAFKRLSASWRREVAHCSCVSEMAMHPAYQRIIGLGPAVVPLLLRELERRPDHWFWALKAITGADPVPPEDRGRVGKMTAAWLKWAKEQRLA